MLSAEEASDRTAGLPHGSERCPPVDGTAAASASPVHGWHSGHEPAGVCTRRRRASAALRWPGAAGGRAARAAVFHVERQIRDSEPVRFHGRGPTPSWNEGGGGRHAGDARADEATSHVEPLSGGPASGCGCSGSVSRGQCMKPDEPAPMVRMDGYDVSRGTAGFVGAPAAGSGAEGAGAALTVRGAASDSGPLGVRGFTWNRACDRRDADESEPPAMRGRWTSARPDPGVWRDRMFTWTRWRSRATRDAERIPAMSADRTTENAAGA